MELDLISKKELLELTGISYGALYRWKRKNLIPEEWFVRKSTFTGQETFFPKDRILARIDKIKNMKEDLSLDDLAVMFSPNPAEIVLQRHELTERNIVTKMAVDFFVECCGDIKVFQFDKVLFVYVLDKMLQSGSISLDEGKILLKTMEDHYKKFEGRNCELVFVRKFGISTGFLVLSPVELYFESSARVVAQLNLSGCIEELKIKLSNGGI